MIASCQLTACSSITPQRPENKITIPEELKTPCVPAKLKGNTMGDLLRVSVDNARIINDCERRKKAIIGLVE